MYGFSRTECSAKSKGAAKAAHPDLVWMYGFSRTECSAKSKGAAQRGECQVSAFLKAAHPKLALTAN